jgi:hypothetical protein
MLCVLRMGVKMPPAYAPFKQAQRLGAQAERERLEWISRAAPVQCLSGVFGGKTDLRLSNLQQLYLVLVGFDVLVYCVDFGLNMWRHL